MTPYYESHSPDIPHGVNDEAVAFGSLLLGAWRVTSLDFSLFSWWLPGPYAMPSLSCFARARSQEQGSLAALLRRLILRRMSVAVLGERLSEETE